MQVNQRAGTANPFPYEASNVLLGRGGSGAVFLARTIDTKEMVAIKRQYTRAGVASNPTSSSSNRSSSLVRRIGSIVEQRSHQNSDAVRSSGSSSSPTLSQPPYATSAFVRELKNEEDAEEASNMEVMAWQREEGSPAAAPALSVSTAGGDGDGTHARVVSEEVTQTSSCSEDELHILQYVGFHPHIVRCLGDFTSARNVSYLALELMETDVAKEVHKGNADLMQEDVCRVIMFSVLLALDYIHHKGVAHRDVKPGNLLLKMADKDTSVFVPTAVDGSPQASPTKSRKAYQVSLGDFSAAHTANGVKNKSIAANRGTLYYKAPEQLLSKEIHSYAACDMWALGCTMFEVATGTIAFFGKTELQVQLQIFHRMGSSFDTYPFQAAAPLLFDSMSVSPSFHDLLQHLLVLNPQARYTAKEALMHPFFAGLRQKHSEASSRLGQPVAMSFPLRLVTSGAMAHGTKLNLPFTAVNPTARPKRKNGACREGETTRPSLSPIEMKRSPIVKLNSPESNEFRDVDGHNSLLSDGTSVHWSQIRSMIADGSSLMDTSVETRPSGESPVSLPRRSNGNGGTGTTAAVFSAVRRLPTPSKKQSPVTGVTVPPRLSSDAQGYQTTCNHNNNNSGSLGRSLSGSGSDSGSFALPRVTFGSETNTLSVDRDRSGSVPSAHGQCGENQEAREMHASMHGNVTIVAPSSGKNEEAAASSTQRGRVPVLQQPAKSSFPTPPVPPPRQPPLEAPAYNLPGSRQAVDAFSRPQVPVVAAYRGLFLGDDEERPSSSEQSSQAHLPAGSAAQAQQFTASSSAARANDTGGSPASPSHAFKFLQFESPRPSSGGGSSTDGSSARAMDTGTATTVRPAVRPFVAPAHTITGRTSSRHRSSGRSLPSQRHTPHLGSRDPNCETPSARSEFMVSCCSTVTCSPNRAVGSARAIKSSRSETGSFFSDPALASTAAPQAPSPQLDETDQETARHQTSEFAHVAALPCPDQQGPAFVAQPFPLPVLLTPSAATMGDKGGGEAGTGLPHMPLFMPSSSSSYGTALPRPVHLADVVGPASSTYAPPTVLADLTNVNTSPPQYNLFCVSSRHRGISAPRARLAGTVETSALRSPNPRLPVAPTGTLHTSADRDTSKKRPREEEETERSPPSVRT